MLTGKCKAGRQQMQSAMGVKIKMRSAWLPPNQFPFLWEVALVLLQWDFSKLSLLHLLMQMVSQAIDYRDEACMCIYAKHTSSRKVSSSILQSPRAVISTWSECSFFCPVKVFLSFIDWPSKVLRHMQMRLYSLQCIECTQSICRLLEAPYDAKDS